MKKVPTPGKTTCEEVAALLKLPLRTHGQGDCRDAATSEFTLLCSGATTA